MIKIIEDNVPLRDYLDTRIEDLSLRLDQRINSTSTLISKLEDSTSTRFATVNEFRHALSDQANNFITRPEHNDLSNRIDRLEERINISEGKSKGLNAWWGYLVGAAGLIIAGISIFSF